MNVDMSMKTEADFLDHMPQKKKKKKQKKQKRNIMEADISSENNQGTIGPITLITDNNCDAEPSSDTGGNKRKLSDSFLTESNKMETDMEDIIKQVDGAWVDPHHNNINLNMSSKTFTCKEDKFSQNKRKANKKEKVNEKEKNNHTQIETKQEQHDEISVDISVNKEATSLDQTPQKKKKKKHKRKVMQGEYNVEISKIRPNTLIKDDSCDVELSADTGGNETEHEQSGKANKRVTNEENGKHHDRFECQIQNSTWISIKPEQKVYSGKGRLVRRMSNNWTDVLSDNIKEFYPGCVLGFKSHHVKKTHSRKMAAPFLIAKARCNGERCHAQYTFTIHNEPSDSIDDVTVFIERNGQVSHTEDEVNRRHVTGTKRGEAAQSMIGKTAASQFYENLMEADQKSMELGNYTSVPNMNVLRKIISEETKKQNFHENILAELQIMKDSYGAMGDQYIQELGMDPFYMILFSKEQIDFVSKNKDKIHLHLDATGSVMTNMPNQKRPYLYSLVMRPNQDLPPVSVGDMISTKHTVPRIQYFLATFLHALKDRDRNAKVSKIETDFSLTLIQAALHTCNGTNIQGYVNQCYNMIKTKEIPTHMTVIHLCAAHMLRDYMRQMKNYKVKMAKEERHFVYRCFALLQNTTTMTEAKSVFKDVCTVLKSPNLTENTEDLKEKLQKKMKSVTVSEEDDDLEDDDYCDFKEEKETEKCQQLIRESAFRKDFQLISDQTEPEKGTKNNPLYCPEAIQCMLEMFMALFPLWSGVMLQFCGMSEKSRDTNSIVEGYFKVLKREILIGRNKRPAHLVIAIRKFNHGRIYEMSFPGARKKSSKKRQGIEFSEEVWKRPKHSIKKTKYQPKQRPLKSSSDMHAEATTNDYSRKKEKQSSKAKFSDDLQRENQTPNKTTTFDAPDVAKWGGEAEGRCLSNTCTIDNGMTILHIKATENVDIMNKIQMETTELYQTLMTMLKLMSEKKFSEAKLVWVNFIKMTTVTSSESTNLFGDEHDFFFTFFGPEWRSSTTSTCSDHACPKPNFVSGEQQGIIIPQSHPPCPVDPQRIVNEWMRTETPCWASTGDSAMDCDMEMLNEHCQGRREVRRTIRKSSPILVLRLYEYVQNQNGSIHEILQHKDLTIERSRYTLAGCTMHKNSHYCAVVCTQKGDLWYDGLAGRLQPLPKDVKNWSPSHAIYCEV